MWRPRVLSLCALLLVSVALDPAGADRRNRGSGSVPCGTDGTITWSPTLVWPPTHKDVPVTFAYRDRDGGNVTLTITAKPHSQIVAGEEIGGSGDTPSATDQVGGANSDVDGAVEVVGSVRSERSTRERPGRTYSFEYAAGQGTGEDYCASDPEDDGDDLTVYVPFACRGNSCSL